ncbi:MAG: hypothetical protein IPP76_13115 [Moraxellaceae bacterium]|nr:hypothetical protein [Moraxellaceae bacterium]
MSAFYRNTYGLTDDRVFDSTKLGLWQRTGNDNVTQLVVTFNLQKDRDINMYLDSTIWKPLIMLP